MPRPSRSTLRSAGLAFVLGAAAVFAAAQEAPAATCAQITSNGNTFTLNAQYTCGQFATGDWWVTPNTAGGTVTITAMTPSPYSSGCTKSGRHGWEVNPAQGGSQAFDSRSESGYSAARMPCLPYAAAVGQSIVKAQSWNISDADCSSDGQTYACLESVAILTVLASPPPADAFRPPYSGTQKPIYTVSQLRLGMLPRLAKPGSTPTIAATRAIMGGPWLDHIEGWPGRDVHPRASMRNLDGSGADYGAEVARSISEVILRTLHDDTIADKQSLAVPAVQWGIDLYAQLRTGQNWKSNGGHASGRKLPILYAGFLLNDPGMLAIGTSYNSLTSGGDCDRYFGEDGQTYYGANGEALWGEAGSDQCGCGGTYGGSPGYGNHLGSGCGSGHVFCRDPNGLVDGGHAAIPNEQCRAIATLSSQRSSGNSEMSGYQWCCTSAPWVGNQIAALLLGLKTAWNYNAFFDYVDRFMSPPWSGEGAYESNYAFSMYRAYRSCTPNCPGQQQGGDTTPPSPPVLLE